MKKFVALALVLVLAIGIASTALASTEYNSDILKGLGWKSASMTATDSDRVMTGMTVLVCYMFDCVNSADIIDKLDLSGTAYMADWGSCMDIYYPLKAGGNQNLFVGPLTGLISDYGTSNTISTAKDYVQVSMTSITARLLDFANQLQN